MVTEKIKPIQQTETNDQTRSKKTAPRIRPSMKKESILASDYNKYILPFSCEECSHFHREDVTCTFGLTTYPHLQTTQQKSYALSGSMALCRFQEID
ncbi:MAG: hypothetical protein H7256_01370 [Bdellovibrio sp.]|nr:hypothetical protein [Bdellovibrio sp.]